MLIAVIIPCSGQFLTMGCCSHGEMGIELVVLYQGDSELERGLTTWVQGHINVPEFPLGP